MVAPPGPVPLLLAACSLQLAACSLQLAACSLQLAACSSIKVDRVDIQRPADLAPARHLLQH
ncbi:hypothetical protein EGJ22_04675 [Pseudomonas sp. p99-361]|nr:hypothetical protein EGJ22_04675 [Pseudomonas sp. p99-361]